MLRLYKEREEKKTPSIAATAIIENADNQEDEELLSLPSTKGQETYKDVHINEDLTPSQKEDIKTLVKTYQHIFTEVPGCTTLVKHNIKLTTDTPIRSKPYPLPYAMR